MVKYLEAEEDLKFEKDKCQVEELKKEANHQSNSNLYLYLYLFVDNHLLKSHV